LRDLVALDRCRKAAERGPNTDDAHRWFICWVAMRRGDDHHSHEAAGNALQEPQFVSVECGVSRVDESGPVPGSVVDVGGEERSALAG
jgi:hypothetical protein